MLVPALPPTVNGLGDFAWVLANSLKKQKGMDTVFLNSDKDFSGKYVGDFKVRSVKDRSSETMLQHLTNGNPDFLIINYVGYAYSQNGTPSWVLNAIEKWKTIKPQCKVLTIFHEVYASGYPWKKAFWLHWFQKSIAFRLLQLSEYSISNTMVTFEILKRNDRHNNISLIPVFSNVGEPEVVPDFSNRENTLVIFGSAPIRDRIFAEMTKFASWVKHLNVQQIIEIGPLRNNRIDLINGIPIISMGVLPSKDISAILLKSKFGMLNYPIQLISKSGVFAAYASHGVVPVVIDHNKEVKKGNLPNGLYLTDMKDSVDYREVSNNLLSWYSTHNVQKTTELVYSLVDQNY
jgi:hypothetical protein